MRTFLASILIFLSLSVAASACPSWQIGGANYSFTGQDLYTPRALGVNAGGNNDLAGCGLGNVGRGYARSAPDFTLNLSGMEPYRLVMDVDASCDTTLLVNTANATWAFDDDSNGNLQPRLELTDIAQINGRVDVWVGTYNGTSCGATLNLETFFSNSGAPAPTPAAGCPTWAVPGAQINATGDMLYSPQRYGVTAMGGADLGNCDGGGRGYAPSAPQYSFNLSGMDQYRLDIDVDAPCDTVLLVNTADTVWHFNDDGGAGLNPSMSLQGAGLNGRVDVWVGTYGGGSCQATLEMETFFASAPAPTPAPQPAAGCPTYSLQGVPVTATGQFLYSPQAYSVQAGGSQRVGDCGIPGAFGYANAAPTYTFFLSGMEEYRLAIDVDSQCDATLLVNTADGQWFFDDDSNGNLDPRLDLRGANLLNGRVDVWVGTFGGGACPATLNMETWFN